LTAAPGRADGVIKGEQQPKTLSLPFYYGNENRITPNHEPQRFFENPAAFFGKLYSGDDIPGFWYEKNGPRLSLSEAVFHALQKFFEIHTVRKIPISEGASARQFS
jgi:hypothetical protein